MKKRESTQAIFVLCNGMYSVRVRAKKCRWRNSVHVRKSRDKEGNGILLANELQVAPKKKGRKKRNGLTSNDKRLIVIEITG